MFLPDSNIDAKEGSFLFDANVEDKKETFLYDSNTDEKEETFVGNTMHEELEESSCTIQTWPWKTEETLFHSQAQTRELFVHKSTLLELIVEDRW